MDGGDAVWPGWAAAEPSVEAGDADAYDAPAVDLGGALYGADEPVVVERDVGPGG